MVIINNIDKLLTVKEVCEILHVHPNTLRRWSDSGRIKSLRITHRGDRRFRYSEVESFLNSFDNYTFKSFTDK
jgi:excisionase family DNA binding protein